MTLQYISDRKLLIDTKILVNKECEIIGKIINHLEEIEARKLYSDLKYHSLYDYCSGELGYSKDQAYRRISAMRLGKSLPEAKEKLEKGSITLSSANMFSSLINNSEMDHLEQREVLKKIDGKSKQETIKIIEDIRTDKKIKTTKKRTMIKDESSNSVRLSTSISKKTMEKINRLKGLYGHQQKDMDEILDLMADALLKKHEENLKPKRISKKKETKGRYLSKEVKYTVYKRAKGKCELCGGVHKLQYDHITPKSRAGANNLSNIRLLCSACNLRQGVLHFGAEKMKRRTPLKGPR